MNKTEYQIRLIALRDVLFQNDPNYLARVRIRWFSETFATPYQTVVDEIPYDVVLQAFYERHYEALRDSAETTMDMNERKRLNDELEVERKRLTMSPEELYNARREEDARDFDTARMLQFVKKREEPVQLKELPEDVDIDFAVDMNGSGLGLLGD